MECKKYNSFVVKPKTKTKTNTKTLTRVEGDGLSKANEKKKDIFYAKGIVKLSKSD